MKAFLSLLIAMSLTACKDTPSAPPPPLSKIISYVHFETAGIAGKKIELMQTGEQKFTDSTGIAEFSVTAGHYVIRATDINTGGPGLRTIDFNVDSRSGESVLVDIVDCLPCALPHFIN